VTIDNLKTKFKQYYGVDAAAVYFCPGRVNLIGEHIDYNGGLVMPCAVTFGTWLLLSPNDTDTLCFKSLNFEGDTVISIGSNIQKSNNSWYNYPLGVVCHLTQQGVKVDKGLNMLFYGNLPIGAGLSSSASIEVVTAFALNEIFDGGLSKLDLVKLTKTVENDFIGVNSGIMDQFAVAFGEKDKALKLDCETLEYEAVDIDLDDYALAIINTNKARNLSESKYNERVAECQTALHLLRQELHITQLCQIDTETLLQHKHLIANEIIWKRARHVVEENDRVKQAAEVLKKGDLKSFGNLMNLSHQSLKELYEVSGAELDTIAEYSRYYKDVLGARMTGAGFGGCAIALVKAETFDDFSNDMTDYYTTKFGYAPTIYKSIVGNGVEKIAFSRSESVY
jgi:galactokinase